jgi:hypothetical protein
MYFEVGKKSTCSKFKGQYGVLRNLLLPYCWWYTNGWDTYLEVGIGDVSGKMDIDKGGGIHQIELGHH